MPFIISKSKNLALLSWGRGHRAYYGPQDLIVTRSYQSFIGGNAVIRLLQWTCWGRKQRNGAGVREKQNWRPRILKHVTRLKGRVSWGGVGHTLSITKADLSLFLPLGWATPDRGGVGGIPLALSSDWWRMGMWSTSGQWDIRMNLLRLPGNQSVQFSRSVMSDSLRSHGLQHARPPCPSPTPGVYSDSCLLSRCCHPAISSSVVPFSSCLQSFPASGSLQLSQLFASGGQSIGVSASTSVLSMNIQAWFHLGWTGWISLLSKYVWVNKIVNTAKKPLKI